MTSLLGTCTTAPNAQQTTIYAAVDLSSFHFTSRCNTFNWRLLHGLDVDGLVRLNDTKKLEAVIPALQQGSIDAEPTLSSHNYVQLFRLLQLAVEHLWQMRESHAKLYPAYAAAGAAAESWKAAAGAYLDVGSQLLSQLQSEQGAVLTEQVLTEVAAAREALEKADAAYNTALDKLEAEDTAARGHSLRRQRLEISWRLVFGLDVQHMLITGSVSELEQLLPQVAYGNIMAENLAALTPAHFRQLLLLGQACLDYLHAICCATSKVLEHQVQQLATSSGPIPELTTSCEELRGALAIALSGSIKVLKAGIAPASPVSTARRAVVPATPTVMPNKPPPAAAAGGPGSPSCHHIVHMHMSGHQRSSSSCDVAACSSPCVHAACVSPRHACVSPVSCCQHTRHTVCACCSSKQQCCCGMACGSGWPERSALLSGRLFDVGLTPAAAKLQHKMDQLDRDLRQERESTLGMRQALEEITSMLLQDTSTGQHHQQSTHKQHRQGSPSYRQQQQQPHTVNVPVTISMTGEGGRGAADSQPESPGSPLKDPSGAVRVLINEDAIRCRERSAAGQQLSEHISDIIMGHQLTHDRTSPVGNACGSSSGGWQQQQQQQFGQAGTSLRALGRAVAADRGNWGGGGSSGPLQGPFVTVRSIPSSSGGRLWRTGDSAASGSGFTEADQGLPGGFTSGPVRGWAGRSAGRVSKEFMQEAMGLGLGEFMIQQLQLQQQQQQQWPNDPQQASGVQAGGAAPAAAAVAGPAPAPALNAGGLTAATDCPPHQSHTAAPAAVSTDPAKKLQQELFKEAATGGFRKLLRSVSPKRMFGSRPGSSSGKTSLQWPGAAPGGGGSPGSLSSSPDCSPTRSGRSFTASAAARAAEELGGALASPAVGQFSPLKASIVAAASGS